MVHRERTMEARQNEIQFTSVVAVLAKDFAARKVRSPVHCPRESRGRKWLVVMAGCRGADQRKEQFTARCV